MSFVPDDQPAEVLQPREQALNFPASAISTHPTQVLCGVSSVRSVGSDQFDSVLLEFCVQFVGIVSIIGDQVPWRLWNNHLDKSHYG
jgi:hypothetical protein